MSSSNKINSRGDFGSMETGMKKSSSQQKIEEVLTRLAL